MPNSANLVTDLPADFNVFGQGVDTSMQFLLGGTTGQVLSKTSATNMAFTWINNDTGDITGVTAGTGITGGGTSGTVTVTNDMATTITAAGDIVVGTGSGTYDNLPIGTTAQVLTADTTVSPYKVKWATPASGSSNPAFSVTTTSVQNFSSTTWTKVAFTSETFDTNNSFDSTTNYRFTPATAGIYSMSWIIEMAAGSSSYFYVAIYKNGNNWQTPTKQGSFTDFLQSGASLITMNGSTDYLEMYVYVSGSSPSLPIGTQAFAGAWIRSN